LLLLLLLLPAAATTAAALLLLPAALLLLPAALLLLPAALLLLLLLPVAWPWRPLRWLLEASHAGPVLWCRCCCSLAPAAQVLGLNAVQVNACKVVIVVIVITTTTCCCAAPDSSRGTPHAGRPFLPVCGRSGCWRRLRARGASCCCCGCCCWWARRARLVAVALGGFRASVVVS
jgi:hypothetical protein